MKRSQTQFEATKPVFMFPVANTVEEIDEKLNELVQSVEDRIQAMNEVNDLGNPELPF